MNTLADAMREAYNATTKDKPESYVRVAEELVALRATMTGPDGGPDWRGRSWDYRMAVAGAMGEANIPLDERIRFGNAVRYHVSKVLRRVAPAPALSNLDLRLEDSMQRSRQSRDKRREELFRAREAGFSKENLTIKSLARATDKETLREQLAKMLADLDGM